MNERSFIFFHMDSDKTIAKGEKTATRILKSGTKAFAKNGYAATSMREIAAGAGIGAGAIYNHFSSKQEILVSILIRHMESLLDAIKAATTLEQFVKLHISYHHDKTDEVFLSYMELRNLEDENITLITALRDQYEARLCGILATGEYNIPDIAVTAKAIIGMLASLPNWYQEGGRLVLDELIQIYWQLTKQMVGKGE